MQLNKQVDGYIASLPEWQQTLCTELRQWIHQAEPNIVEEIIYTNRPYFIFKGSVCALLATKDHVNVFIYDPTAPDPTGIINQGHGNATARAIQIYEGDSVDETAFVELIRAIANRNRQGGWRKLKNLEQ